MQEQARNFRAPGTHLTSGLKISPRQSNSVRDFSHTIAPRHSHSRRIYCVQSASRCPSSPCSPCSSPTTKSSPSPDNLKSIAWDAKSTRSFCRVMLTMQQKAA